MTSRGGSGSVVRVTPDRPGRSPTGDGRPTSSAGERRGANRESSRRPTSARPAFAYLASGLAATAAYYALPRMWQNPVFDAIGASSVVAIIVGTILYRPRRPWAWRLMALGQLMSVVGDLSWTVYDVVLLRAPFLSAADVAYLAAYVPLTAGLLLIVRTRRPGRDLTSLIDAAIITVAVAVAAWMFVMAPQATRVGASRAETIVSLAYPAADVLLIAVASAFVFTKQTRLFASQLIGASLIALVTADILFIPAALSDRYQTGSLIDIGWMLSYVLWGAAALHPSMRELTEPAPERETPRFTRRRLVIEAVAVFAIPLMWVVQTLRDEPRHSFVVVAASTLAAFLVITRMGGLLSALESAALRDPLTGLPNRRLLLDRIGQALRRAERTGTPVAVLFLDLTGFKEVNDRFGHHSGDEALIEVGRRIEGIVRRTDTVARLGGDEFVIVCEGLDQARAEAIAHRIRAGISAPLEVRDELVELSVDLGIAVEEEPATGDVDVLLQAADRAMYRAKAAQRRSAE